MPKKSLPDIVHIMILLTVSFLAGCGRPDLETQWQTYKQRFVRQGRVVDTGNGGISHSEGQGYAMLLAVATDDRETFEQLWHWTRTRLQTRGDHLFMWRRRPGVPMAQEDPNNATDGDILIAWALLEAAERWRRPNWKREAQAILDDLKTRVIRHWQEQTVLLPGSDGFEHENRLVLNLSYWVFPALARFATADADPIWQTLTDSGLDLLKQARFGDWRLPSDWIEAAETLRPDPDHPPLFGYDAVRIPLYLVWAGYRDEAFLEPFSHFWESFAGFTPPWLDLQRNCLGAYPAGGGTRAVRELTRFALGRNEWRRLPTLTPKDDYYSASLILLSRLAAGDGS